tara:strand:+ start:345 stop:1475 length:1131 start_codon:yes stop_codon:yes gene_type:complete
MKFTIKQKDKSSNARRGIVSTDHGDIQTPAFMPVGTLGAVKAVHIKDIKEEINPDIILGNTYHLYLRPGLEIIKSAGGLHKFNAWDKPILTDSGGYQVYSLAQMRKITEKGVRFQSHIDGSYHLFTPENVMDIQRVIGADIIMAFDECTPYPCEYKYAERSMHMTHRWLKRCCTHFDQTEDLYGYSQTLFPIVQGSVYKDLRKKSAEYIASMDREGNAIGGLSVGEPHDMMYEMTEVVCNILPVDKARYLMGVGLPQNLLECISLGIDMFDCVLPTRNARNGMIFTHDGIMNIRNKKWENDHSPIDSKSQTFAAQEYSKAFLRHMMRCNEILGAQIATIINLSFYMWVMEESRNQIENGTFAHWKDETIKRITKRL